MNIVAIGQERFQISQLDRSQTVSGRDTEPFPLDNTRSALLSHARLAACVRGLTAISASSKRPKMCASRPDSCPKMSCPSPTWRLLYSKSACRRNKSFSALTPRSIWQSAFAQSIVKKSRYPISPCSNRKPNTKGLSRRISCYNLPGFVLHHHRSGMILRDQFWFTEQANLSLERLLPRIQVKLEGRGTTQKRFCVVCISTSQRSFALLRALRRAV